MNWLKRVRAFQIELEFGLKCQFLRRGKNRSTRSKTSQRPGENQQKINPNMVSTPGFEAGATLVGEGGSHLCDILAPCTLTLFKRSCDSHQPRQDFIFRKYPAQVSLQSISARFGDTKCLPLIFNSSVCLYFAARHQPKSGQDISNKFDGKDS